METIRTVLFEDPLYIYFTLGGAWLVLGAIWWERRSRKWAMTLLIPLVLGGAVALVEHLVVTDREQMVNAVHEIAADIERGKLDMAELYLDDQWTQGYWITKDAALLAGRLAIDKFGIHKVKIQKVTVEVAGQTARMHLVTWVAFKAAEGEGSEPLVWELEWIRRDAGWRIIKSAEPRRQVEF